MSWHVRPAAVRGVAVPAASALPNSRVVRRAAVAAACEWLEERRLFATFVVNSTSDTISVDGLLTLREAITAANTNAASGDAAAGSVGLDTINFNIAGAGPHVITPVAGGLPTITEALTINGYSQPGSSANANAIGAPINANIRIVLSGAAAGGGAAGLTIVNGGTTVRGLNIQGFDFVGVSMPNIGANSGNVIAGNFIGTNVAGTAAAPNGSDGVLLFSGDNTVGGTNAPDRNLISGNDGHGVVIIGPGGASNDVIGNYIGTSASGLADLGNGQAGVFVGGSANQIGGAAAAGNVISGNLVGVAISGPGAAGNFVQGNRIGVNAPGAAALGNSDSGVIISDAPNNTIGGAAIGFGNVISANGADGVNIGASGASGNTVTGNLVGLDVTGLLDLGNALRGVVVIADNNTVGGTVAGSGNAISGNAAAGVTITGLGNVVQRNLIGLNIAGAAVTNSGPGVHIIDGDDNSVGTAGNGNVISGNGGSGVLISSSAPGLSSGNTVAANTIRLDPAGAAARPNAQDGVTIISSPDNTVGGSTPADRNVISGNTTNGVNIAGAASTGNFVKGNYIGTNSAGDVDLGNVLAGVLISTNATLNQIGGDTAGDRNVISGNDNGGVRAETGANSNVILGNYIGTNAAGAESLGNTLAGVTLNGVANSTVGGTVPGAGNVISGNGVHGIHILGAAATNNTVAGNLIGTDAAGTADLGNAAHGVLVDAQTTNNTIGGTIADARNVISGNTASGVLLNGAGTSGNTVLGNYIGTDITGTVPISNSTGVFIIAANNNTIGGAAPGARNIISGNGTGLSIISLGATANRVLGNYIGTDVTGNAALQNIAGISIGVGAPGNTIGGAAPGEGNVISGNQSAGVNINDATDIFGNFIGTNAAGTAAVPNGNTGITVTGNNTRIGGAAPGQGNVISGNAFHGISTSSASLFTPIQGNRIGTDVTGLLPIANGVDGILLGGDSATVGGTAAGEANVIAFNFGIGVNVATTGQINRILSNSIHTNAGLGIDLTGDGPTPNDAQPDADVGANGLQNAPDLASATTDAVHTTVNGFLISDVNTAYTVQFFANPSGDPSTFGEGKIFIGNSVLTTNGSGFALIAADFPVPVPAGYSITATATQGTTVLTFGATSEFSDFVVVASAPPAITISDVVVVETNALTTQAVFTVTRSSSAGVTTVFFKTADGTAVAEQDYLAQEGTLTFIGGQTTKTITVTINGDTTLETDETFKVNLSAPTNGFIDDPQGVGTITNDDVAPTLSITDVTQLEGTGGVTTFTFNVNRAGDTTGLVSVNFATADGSAVAPGDYLSQAGTLNFGVGVTTLPVSVTVVTDADVETDQQFVVNLSGATGASIADGQGVGTILNDDFAPPTFSIDDVTLAEGSGGGTTAFTFTVTRNGFLGGASSVQAQTANGSAVAPGDFAAPGLTTLNFGVGVATQTFTVQVGRDAAFEPDEQFFVNLSNPVNGTIADAQGVGTILNDDVISASAVLGPDPGQPGKTALLINGTDGPDVIDLDAANSSKVKVFINAVFYGEFNTSAFSRLYIFAHDGDDHVSVATKYTKDAVIVGGLGNDDMKGGYGKDVILGNEGNDILSGRKGRDVLIGGVGADGLAGNEDDDLLIAAATIYDADYVGLLALQKEWVSSNNYAKRVSNLKAGAGSNLGGRALNDATVIDDVSIDILTGSAATDAFFAQKDSSGVVKDTIADKSGSETLVDVN